MAKRSFESNSLVRLFSSKDKVGSMHSIKGFWEHWELASLYAYARNSFKLMF